jgi:hypothetical protein
MRLLFIFVTLFFALFSLCTHAKTLREYPNTIENRGTSLQLNGIGLREKWFIDVYSAALYLGSIESNANKIIKSDQAIALKLTMLRDVAGENMSDAIKEGFANNAVDKTELLQAKVAKFLKIFGNEASEGNSYLFFYTPSLGTQIYINGEHNTTIDGLDFKRALFSIWLGEKPAQASLKTQLLSSTKD